MKQEQNKAISILVVEDNQIDALVVKTLLQNHFNIYVAENGNAALIMLENHKINIILMDINLGNDLDGITLLGKIRENKKNDHIKVFAVTAYPHDREEFIEKGFDELYIKPVIKEEMFEAINKITKKD